MFVEYEPQTRIEGDMQQMPADFAVTELWRVLARHGARAATRDAEVTVFDSVGFALEDFSALRFLHELALSRNRRADRPGAGARRPEGPVRAGRFAADGAKLRRVA